MASFLWTSVFVFLLLELGLTTILVLPVPRKLRNWICRQATKLDLKEKLKPALWGIGAALAIALLDCLSLLNFLFAVEHDAHDRYLYQGGGRSDALLFQIDKEKEYKTERNIYLTGFALTLLFVIGRITDLMQEHVELEDDLQKARAASKQEQPVVDSSTDEPAGTSEIEMKPLQDKKKD
eukprot:Nitzschia sp. Nitz4//scaffold106_size73319//21810//22349//NITZ4_005731-RA/size73319-processed-gene-0.39-mRNA-1//1//CDS//3329532505//3479//frame0